MPDHSDYRALLRAICESPDDDLPRLVLADWLDEHDEPRRAAFIRRQIENARRDDGRTYLKWAAPPSVRRPLTLDAIASVEPWRMVREDHVTPLLVITSDARSLRRCVGWHRGFPAVVGCTERSWHEHYRLFPTPVDVFFCDTRSMVWGAYLQRATGTWRMVSLVAHNIDTPDRDHMTATREGFPNVRNAYGFSCGDYALNQFVNHYHWQPVA